MIRRIMSLFMIPILLLLSICNVTVVYAEEVNNVTNDTVSFRGYEFQSYEPGEDDAKLYAENGMLIYEIDKLSLEDWQNKVFIDSGVTFEKGKRYTVDFTISASKDTYFSFFVNQIGVWNPAISESLNIGDYVENYSYTTSVIDDDMAMEVLFQFGGSGNQVPLKVSISNFAIYEAAAAEETTLSYKVADFNGLSVSAEGAVGSSLYIERSGLVFETAEDGKVKIEDLSFKKGCDYEIIYTIRADKNVQLACSLDPMGGYFAPGEFISLSGESQTISRRTGVQQADRQMEITFDLNKAKNGELAKIVFDQIVIKEVKDGQEQISRNAWVVDGFRLNHDESGGAAADFDIDEAGDVVYRIEKIGENDWNNKVMIDRDVTFVKGNSYKVDIALETDKEIHAFFGVNPKNKWEPKISETLLLKEGVNEFSFTTDTQTYDEDMEVLFQFGGFGNTAPCNVKIKAVSIESASADDIAAVEAENAANMEPILAKQYNFSKLDNYKFKGFVMNDPSGSELYLEQGVLVYDIKAFGVNQLIKKDLWLSKNSRYNIEMEVSASRRMNVECYISDKGTQKELDKSTRTIGSSIEVIKAEFRTGDTEGQGRIVFDLSNNQESGKFYVHSVVVKAIEEGIESTYPMDLLDLDDPDIVHTDSKSNATPTLVDGGLSYAVKRFGGNPWENKITLNNIADFKKDKTYIVDFDMSSTESIVFTCVLHNLAHSDGDDEWEYFWERNHVIGGKKQHFRYSFKASEDNSVNEMIIELGGQGNNKKGSASIFISDIKITQCANYRNETIKFPGAEGVFSYEHNGSSASGKLYQEDDVLIYEIGREGIADWHNQLIFNQGITFEEGYRYRIDVTASASKSTNMKFSLVSQADWSEKIKKYSILSTKESTLSFETDTVQDNDENMEFSLRFGGMYNQGNTTIRISDIKIYKINPLIACTDTAFDDDLEIEYENSDFYESVDFKGYTFNSTLIDNADASLYEQNGILHYDIREIGSETYHNKLSINHELTAKSDKNYIFEITARADKPMKFFFAVNGIDGGWNPLVAETIELTEDYATYTFRTNSQDVDKDVELIFEFGANGNTAPNHVYIKDFNISEVNDIVDEVVVTFKGNDFTHEETGGNAKGILYTNDAGNMVYYAKKLGNTPSDNRVSMSATLKGDKDNKIEITLKPQKGLDVNVNVIDAASGEKISSTAEWIGDNEEKKIALSIAAQGADRDIIVSIMFGQTAFAEDRGNNRIEFIDFSITESEPIFDAGTVIFGEGNYEFKHEESGDVAKGILYLDADGNMVYYAKKLGNTDWHNKVFTVIEGVEAGAQYTLTVEIEPEKGLDMVTTIPNAKNAEADGDAWYRDWLAPNASTTFSHKITAQSDALEIFFQFGQEEWAEARENNHIVFKAISIEKNEGSDTDVDTDVDAGTVTFGGYKFTHEESEDAKGSLSMDADGNMVYYAKKLGNTDWHNKVFTVIEGVEAGAQYTLTVEIEPEKGLDMVTTIPNAKNAEVDGDAWYRDWLENSTTLSHKITAQSDTLEIFFQFGQEEWAEARENNHIVFKAISIEKNKDSDTDVDTDVDAGTVTFGSYEFTHEESGDAKGSLSMDADGNMVYYAKKLGNLDWYNKVSTIIKDVEVGAQYTLTVEIEPEKGLDMVTTIPNAKNAEVDEDAWYRDWLENSTTLSHKITAQSDTLEIFFQFGQEEWAEARENNHIVFKAISIEKNEGSDTDVDTDIDAGTVTFGGYEFTHEESEDAKGSLSIDADGNMVYYAEKLGNLDWHNKVSTIIKDVEAGAEYTLTVEVEPEKGLDMVTTIPNAKNAEADGDAWYRDWLAPNTSTTLSHKITAQGDTLEISFQFGQENLAEDREDNHIVFKAISIEKNEGGVDSDVDAGTVTFGGYEFTHEESEGAKGSLSMDADGNMVYYVEKLGNLDWHNKVSTLIKDVEAGAEYTLKVEVEPEKGLDMVTTIPNAKNAEADGDAWYRDWLENSAALSHKITAQSNTLEIFFQFGQEEWAEARDNNHIVFKSISIEKNEGSDTDVDAGTVTFGDYEFIHEESEGAKGSLSMDADGNMVYYAEKLSNTDWHNKVSTIIEGVTIGAEYMLTVEVEPEKGLDMVTTIPNAKNAETDGDAWYRDWLENSTMLSHKITAQGDTLEIFFQFGQEEWAEAREDNHIVFKSILLEEDGIIISLDEEEPEEDILLNEEILDKSENLDAETEQEQEEAEDKQDGKGDTKPNLDKDADIMTPVEQDSEKTENNDSETEQKPEETEQNQKETGIESLAPDSDEKKDAEENDSEESENSGGEDEQQPEETEQNQEGIGTENPEPDSDEKKDAEENDSEESENRDGETEQQPEETEQNQEGIGTENPEPDSDEKKDAEENDSKESENSGGETEQQPEETEQNQEGIGTENPEPDSDEKKDAEENDSEESENSGGEDEQQPEETEQNQEGIGTENPEQDSDEKKDAEENDSEEFENSGGEAKQQPEETGMNSAVTSDVLKKEEEDSAM